MLHSGAGTEPPEPAGLAFTHVPDSVPNLQSAYQALVTLRTTELALVGWWLEHRCTANLLYREAGQMQVSEEAEGAPNSEALGMRELSDVGGNGGPERFPFALLGNSPAGSSEERGVRITDIFPSSQGP